MSEQCPRCGNDLPEEWDATYCSYCWNNFPKIAPKGWNADSCPSCGSTVIEIIGTTKGEDVGDEGVECDKCVCQKCGEYWLVEQ